MGMTNVKLHVQYINCDGPEVLNR